MVVKGSSNFIAYIRIAGRDFAYRVASYEEARKLGEMLKSKYAPGDKRAVLVRVATPNHQKATLSHLIKPHQTVKGPAAGAGEKSSSTRSGRTVLLVDDEIDLRTILAGEFEAMGCTVVQAGSVQDALLVSKGLNIDLVVSDLVMPGGDGWMLVDALEKEGATPSIVMMSAYFDDEHRKRGEQKSIPVFDKPFKASEFATQALKLLVA